MKRSLTVWVLGAILLAGCAMPTSAPDIEIAGPPLISGKKTKAEYSKCRSYIAGTHCEHSFWDGEGTVITTGELARQIVPSLALAKPLHPYIKAYQKQYQPNAASYIRYQRYKLYLVALRPTVIVGVPVKALEETCYGSFETGCFYVGSKETMDAFLHFGKLPPVRSGSFWFLPESGMESTALPDDAKSVTTHFNGIKIVMSQDGGYWRLVPQP